jgi:hypothetical protein
MHFAPGTVISNPTANITLLAAGGATFWTATRFILQALHGEELLLTGSEDKAGAAFPTCQHLVCKRHFSLTSFPRRFLRSGRAMIRGVADTVGVRCAELMRGLGLSILPSRAQYTPGIRT